MRRVRRLRFPAFVAVLGAAGACAGLALAGTPDATTPQAAAKQIDCATVGQEAPEEMRGINRCWQIDLTEPVPSGASALDVAIAKQEALCQALSEVGEAPEFCLPVDSDGSPTDDQSDS